MRQLVESMWVGVEDDYEWIVATCSLGDLLRACPEVVTGRFVALTAFDGGPLVLTEEERAKGWYSRFGIAYSPKITDVNSVPHDNCYDEWYIFDAKTEIGPIAKQGSNIFEAPHSEGAVYQFVNYHLGLQLKEHKPLVDLFWTQIRRLQPDVYVADCNQWVTIVSNNKELFVAARQGIGEHSPA